MMMFRRHHDFPSPHHRASHVAAHIAMAILMGTALVLFFGSVVMYLWNAIMPALFSVGHLTFFRAIGLLILARILVGGFHRGGFGGHRRFGHRGGLGGDRGSWHQYEEWWREAGEQSYRNFSATRNPAAPEGSGEAGK